MTPEQEAVKVIKAAIATQFKAMNDDELMREIKMEWAFRGKDMLDILSNLFAEMCE